MVGLPPPSFRVRDNAKDALVIGPVIDDRSNRTYAFWFTELASVPVFLAMTVESPPKFVLGDPDRMLASAPFTPVAGVITVAPTARATDKASNAHTVFISP